MNRIFTNTMVGSIMHSVRLSLYHTNKHSLSLICSLSSSNQQFFGGLFFRVFLFCLLPCPRVCVSINSLPALFPTPSHQKKRLNNVE